MEKFALIGHNIKYSLSPKIHQIIYGECGINASYELISFSKEEFDNYIPVLLNLQGFNVTKPHKQNIIPYLQKTCLDSVNTVKVVDGQMYGYSTDGYGFFNDLQRNFKDIKGNALILGAGGVAPVIINELKKLPVTIFIKNRTIEKAQKLCNEYNINLYSGQEVDFIINATSLGINDEGNPLDNSNIDISKVKWAYDTIYCPPLTKFLKSFKNAQVQNGLGMLIYQAIEADKIFCNIELTKSDENKLFNIIYKEIEK